MRKMFVLVLVFLCLLANNTLAEVSLKAEVDKPKISLNETLTYKLTITSTEGVINPVVQPPAFKNFFVVSQIQSSSTSFNKGKSGTNIVYVYTLRPKEIGKFTIESASVKIKNETYSTEAFEAEVIENESQTEPPREQKPPLPEKQDQKKEREKVIL